MQQWSGTELRRRREAVGMTRTELAYRVGRSDQIIMGYELDQRVPPVHVLTALAEEVGCTVADLFADVPGTAA